MSERAIDKKKKWRAAWLALPLLLLAFVLWRSLWRPRLHLADLLSGQGIGQPNIILITLDTTRADHLGCYGYGLGTTPNLDKLAAQSILFEQCATASPLTLPAHCSIMTGLYPTFHGVHLNGNTALSETHLTLAEAFASHGYSCAAFIGAFVLDGRWGLKQGFSCYDDQFDLSAYKHLDLGLVQRPGDQVMAAALTWLKHSSNRPFFVWIHLYDPHTPYAPPEPYRSRFAGNGPNGLYDGEIAFADEQIGRCLRWLEENNLRRQTTVAIIGDHGEGLGEHEELTHGYYIYDSVIHVPMLISLPTGYKISQCIPTQVRSIDIYPTLLALAGIPAPAETQGRSMLPLLSPSQPAKERYAYSESLAPNLQYGWSPLYSLRTSAFHFIQAPQAELYHLKNDAPERHNVITQYYSTFLALKRELASIRRETSTGAPAPETADLDKETLNRLATLGYIGAPLKKLPDDNQAENLPDPKEKFSIYSAIQKSGELLNQEKYEAAVVILEEVLAKDRTIPQAMLLLATCYDELGRTVAAKLLLDSLLRQDPNSLPALIALANILKEEGRHEEMLVLCRKALAVDSRNTQAYTLIGEIYMEKKDHASALPYLQKAVAIQPKLQRNRLNLAACFISLKRPGEAQPLIADILRQNPDYPLAHYHLALLWEERGDRAAARREYQEEISLHPHCFPARFNLGQLLLGDGDRQSYLAQMQEIVRLDPLSAEGYLFLAHGLLQETADLAQIQELVEKGLALAKKAELQALAYFLLADIYSRRQQPEKMRAALAKANYFKSR